MAEIIFSLKEHLSLKITYSYVKAAVYASTEAEPAFRTLKMIVLRERTTVSIFSFDTSTPSFSISLDNLSMSRFPYDLLATNLLTSLTYSYLYWNLWLPKIGRSGERGSEGKRDLREHSEGRSALPLKMRKSILLIL
jgi:hypothetical protein